MNQPDDDIQTFFSEIRKEDNRAPIPEFDEFDSETIAIEKTGFDFPWYGGLAVDHIEFLFQPRKRTGDPGEERIDHHIDVRGRK